MNYGFIEHRNIKYHHIYTKICIVLITLILTACGSDENMKGIKPNNQGCPPDLTQKKMLEAINKVRQQGYQCHSGYFSKALRVTWDPLLAKAATIHADDMAKHNYFSHKDQQGKDVIHRLASLGLVGSNIIINISNDGKKQNKLFVGENISVGRDNIDATVKSFLDSKGEHCELLMSSKYTKMGMTCSDNPDSEYGTYWVQIFSADFKLKKTN